MVKEMTKSDKGHKEALPLTQFVCFTNPGIIGYR
jgi:hypothetical protein